MIGKVVRASTQAEGRSDQGEVEAIPQPMVTAAAPAPPQATAAVILLPHLHLPQHLLAVPLDPLPHEGRGGVVALHPTRPVGAAEATAPTDIVVIVVRKAGTGGGAAQSDQVATRKTAVIPGSTGVAGVDPDPERETEAELEPETAAVVAGSERGRKKGKKRGKGVESAEIAVTTVAVNTNKRPLARTEKGGGKGVVVMRKTRKRRIRIGKKRQIRRKKSQSPEKKKGKRKKEAL